MARNMAMLALVLALAVALGPQGVQAQGYCRQNGTSAEPILYAPLWTYLRSNKGFTNPGYQFVGNLFLGLDPYSGNLTTWGELYARNITGGYVPIDSHGQFYLVQAHTQTCQAIPAPGGERLVLDLPGNPQWQTTNCRLMKWDLATGADGIGIAPPVIIPKKGKDLNLNSVKSIMIRELTNRFFVACANLIPLSTTCPIPFRLGATPIVQRLLTSGAFVSLTGDGYSSGLVTGRLTISLDSRENIVANATIIDKSPPDAYGGIPRYNVVLAGYPCGATYLGGAGGPPFKFDQSIATNCASNELKLSVPVLAGVGQAATVLSAPNGFRYSRFGLGVSAVIFDSRGKRLACAPMAYTPIGSTSPSPPPPASKPPSPSPPIDYSYIPATKKSPPPLVDTYGGGVPSAKTPPAHEPPAKMPPPKMPTPKMPPAGFAKPPPKSGGVDSYGR